MRSIAIALVGCAAIFLAACSSQGGTSKAAQKPAAPETRNDRALSRPYIASPQRAMKDMTDTKGDTSAPAAHATAGTPRTGARAPHAATPVARTPIAARTLPESASRPAVASVEPVAAPAPKTCDEELCPGGHCGVPAACFDPCSLCPGGHCAIPAPAFCAPR